MPFKYRAITANCGNDTIGRDASTQIKHLLFSDKADFYVINCQEVDFEAAKKQLEQLVNQGGYKVECLAQMVTHTTLTTQFHYNTGIASYIIYKDGLNINIHNQVDARRDGKRFSGTAYNKGGLVTDFSVERKNGQSIRMQTISGHLDSNTKIGRNTDWSNLQVASSRDKAVTWNELVKACPDLRISGYDANTRDKLENGSRLNLLRDRPDDPEVQAFYRAPLADIHFSAAVTYSKIQTDENEESPTRPGYVEQGMLDYVGIADGREPKEYITTKKVTTVQLEESTARDHCVVISPIQEYTQLSEFDVVKNQIASRLHQVAPVLAREMRDLEENSQSKERLREVYNEYLSTHGLLNTALKLQTKKLTSYERMLDSPRLLLSGKLKGQIAQTLFGNTNWCEGIPEIVAAKQELMSSLLVSLDNCQHYEKGIKARLDWYHDLESQIESGHNIDPKLEFKTKAIHEYLAARDKFAKTLQGYTHADVENCKKFQEAGYAVIAALDLIATPEPDSMNLDAKNLDKMTRVLVQCQKACEVARFNKDALPEVFDKLTNLSQEFTKKSSPLWNVLISALNVFIGFVALIAGLLSINSIVKISEERQNQSKLGDAISAYKSTIKELHHANLDDEVANEAEKEHNAGLDL